MPITLNTGKLNIKNSAGEYVTLDAVADATTAEKVQQINNAGAAQVAVVQQKGAETLATIPNDYTEIESDVTDLKSEIKKISNISENIAFVTDGVSSVYSNVNYAKSGKSTLALYGISTGLGYYNVFNGANERANGTSYTPTKNIKSGVYTVYFEGTIRNALEICYTENTYGDRSVLTSGQTLTVGNNGGCIFARTYSGQNFGTEEAPTNLSLEIYVGEDVSNVPTAIDRKARSVLDSVTPLVDSSYNNIIPNIDWVIGGITSQGNINSTYMYCIRPKASAYLCQANGVIKCTEGYRIRVVKYNTTTMGPNAFVSDSGWVDTSINVFKGEYIAPQIRYGTDSTIVLEDTSISEHIMFDFKGEKPYLNDIAGIASEYRRCFFESGMDFNAWYDGLNPSYTIQDILDKDESIIGRDSKTADIIQVYDALAEDYPDYVTKTDLGLATGSDEQGNPYHLYEYAFIPKDVQFAANPMSRPIVLLDSGMHGFEKGAVYGLYCFMYDVCHNWDKSPALRSIRYGVEIRVIPVVCPYGFDQNERLNANHININRNFDTPNWQAIPAGRDSEGDWESEASGEAPFDQPETEILRKWILKYRNRCLLCMDNHTNGAYNVNSYYDANANIIVSDTDDSYYNRIMSVIRKHICEQTIMWPKEWANLSPSTTIGRFQPENSDARKFGMIHQWLAYTIKQVGLTIEGFNGLRINDEIIVDSMNEQSIKMNSENIGNMVIQMLEEYCRPF